MTGIRDFLQAAMRRWWIMAFVIATLWVWQRYAVVRAGHRIAEHRATLANLIKTRDELLAENTTLSSRVRIESITAARLGLQPTRDSQVIRLLKYETNDTPPSDPSPAANDGNAKSVSTPEPAAKAGSDIASP